MALSKDEQKLLDQMEAALAAEDPKLANKMRGTSRKRLHRRRAALAGVAFLVGIACLIVGLKVHPAMSIGGFVIMLAATVIAIMSWQQVEVEEDGHDDGHPAQQGKPPAGPDVMGKFEDRWRRRQEGDL